MFLRERENTIDWKPFQELLIAHYEPGKAKTGELTETEVERNKAISKYRYIVEQYFGISHQHENGQRALFPRIIKNTIDIMFRQFAFNLRKASTY